eukprot:352456-Chlamydomonas_euryale.AAC.2
MAGIIAARNRRGRCDPAAAQWAVVRVGMPVGAAAGRRARQHHPHPGDGAQPQARHQRPVLRAGRLGDAHGAGTGAWHLRFKFGEGG